MERRGESVWGLSSRPFRKLKMRRVSSPSSNPNPNCFIVKGSVTLLCTIYPSDRSHQKTFGYKFPWEQLQDFKHIDCCIIRHNHDSGDSFRFRKITYDRYLTVTQDHAVTHGVIINSYAYAYFFRKGLMNLNLDHVDKDEDENADEPASSTWDIVPHQNSPNHGDRLYPKLVSLGGLLYVICGYDSFNAPHVMKSFGEIYDPVSKTWGKMSPPPNAELLVCAESLFVASLGEIEAKILVYYPDHENPLAYLYDTKNDIWSDVFRCGLESTLFTNIDVSGSQVVNEDDNTLYWLDKNSTFIFGLEWSKGKLYSGPIMGMEHVFSPRIGLTISLVTFSLHHLSGNLFFLVWTCRNSEEPSATSTIHFTLLSIVKDTSLLFLRAMVVGCFEDTFTGSYKLLDSLLV